MVHTCCNKFEASINVGLTSLLLSVTIHQYNIRWPYFERCVAVCPLIPPKAFEIAIALAWVNVKKIPKTTAVKHASVTRETEC